MPKSRPVDRIRRRVTAAFGPRTAAMIPAGYQRMGRLVLVRLPVELRSHEAEIGEIYRQELHVDAVLAIDRVEKGSRRVPRVRVLSGEGTETAVRDGDLVYRLDAAQLLYSAGNMEERHRIGRLVRPGERVVDLFAGIGYFALPAARIGRASRVVAVEKNPVSFGYLCRNITENRLAGRVFPVLGDNRTVELPPHSFDRVILGYLPSAFPFVGRALELVVEEGGWVHVHSVTSTRLLPRSEQALREIVRRAGGEIIGLTSRTVKSYGPARDHRVWDLNVRPGGSAPAERRSNRGSYISHQFLSKVDNPRGPRVPVRYQPCR